MADTVEVRLKKGAERLGQYWRANERCASGWSLDCECLQKTRFCKAKTLWLELALVEGREFADGPFALALMMRASEWDATSLVMRIDMGGDVGEVRVGRQATLKMADLAAMRAAPDGLKGVVAVLKTFPGSMVQEITPRPAVAASVEGT